jgi:hypothetical protein
MKMIMVTQGLSLTRSQVLEGFKYESKLKIVEEQGVKARSLACSTLEG